MLFDHPGYRAKLGVDIGRSTLSVHCLKLLRDDKEDSGDTLHHKKKKVKTKGSLLASPVHYRTPTAQVTPFLAVPRTQGWTGRFVGHT